MVQLSKAAMAALFSMALVAFANPASAKQNGNSKIDKAYGCTLAYYHRGGQYSDSYQAMKYSYSHLTNKHMDTIDEEMLDGEADLRRKIKSGEVPQDEIDAMPKFCFNEFNVPAPDFVDPATIPYRLTAAEEHLEQTLFCTSIYDYMTDGSGVGYTALQEKFALEAGVALQDANRGIAITTASIVEAVTQNPATEDTIIAQASQCATVYAVDLPSAPPPPIIAQSERDIDEVLGGPEIGDATRCAGNYYRQTENSTPSFEAMLSKMQIADPSLSRFRAIARARKSAAEQHFQDPVKAEFSSAEIVAVQLCVQEFRIASPLSIDQQQAKALAMAETNTRMRLEYEAEIAAKQAAQARLASAQTQAMGNDADYADVDGFLNICRNVEGDREKVPDNKFSEWVTITTNCTNARRDAMSQAHQRGDTAREAYYRDIHFGWQ